MNQKFTAEIIKIGINYCIIAPDKVVAALLRQANKRAGPVLVKGHVNRAELKTNLVRYAGEWRVYLNEIARNDAEVTAGDSANLSLRFDPIPRMPPLPDLFRQALAKNQEAKTAWRLLPSEQRRLIVEEINSKASIARQKNAVTATMQMLLERHARSKARVKQKT